MADTPLYRICDWDKHFENARSRTLKSLPWVRMPTKQDGDGYTELVSHADGAAHFGGWCAIVQVAARCHPRGTLVRAGGIPHDAPSLARMTRLPADLFESLLPRLAAIGWLERLVVTPQGLTAATIPECHDGDTTVTRRRHDVDKKAPKRRGEERREEETSPAKAPKPRKPDPIWDTVVELWYGDGIPPSHRAAVGKIVKDFKALRQVTPDEIRTRHQRIVETWGADKATARCTVTHWSEFGDGWKPPSEGLAARPGRVRDNPSRFASRKPDFGPGSEVG